jgi:hypothetical protein
MAAEQLTCTAVNNFERVPSSFLFLLPHTNFSRFPEAPTSLNFSPIFLPFQVGFLREIRHIQ